MLYFKQMVPATFLTNTDTTLYTCPAAPVKSNLIKEIRLNNTDTSARTFTLRIYPSGGSASDVNILYQTVTLQAAGAAPTVYSVNIVLNPGDVVQGKADTGSKVSIFISGLEEI